MTSTETKIESLKEIEAECKRFMKRLRASISRIKNDDMISYGFGCKESGALRRSAMDLKNELTRITKNMI